VSVASEDLATDPFLQPNAKVALMAKSPKILSPVATAMICDVSCRTLERWRAEGIGPQFIRLGKRKIAYSSQEIDKWIDSQTVNMTAGSASTQLAA
jgi:predicted DNA-binding transcriptional regulator AlpA